MPLNDRIGGARPDPLAAKVTDIIGPTIEDMGFELVRVSLMSQARQVLQIMVDRTDGTQIGVEDCAEVSRQVSAMLDVEDPIKEAYDLEVSSPGIDRPLVKLSDFDTWKGFEAKIELAFARDGRRRYRGRLHGVEDSRVLIDVDGEVHGLDAADIAKAKLVLTDDLLAYAAEQQQTAEQAEEQ